MHLNEHGGRPLRILLDSRDRRNGVSPSGQTAIHGADQNAKNGPASTVWQHKLERPDSRVKARKGRR